MFEVGFTEILLITVLALVVLGPEKLPRVAAQVGRWMGRARAMARQFRDQLEDEVQLAETTKAKPASSASAAPAGAASSDSAASSSGAADTTSTGAETSPPIYEGMADTHSGQSGPSTSDLPPEVAAANAAAETAHSDSNGPAPEPEAPEYQPPVYAQTDANGAHAGAQSTVESPSHPDDPPRKAGDFITQTHERGI